MKICNDKEYIWTFIHNFILTKTYTVKKIQHYYNQGQSFLLSFLFYSLFLSALVLSNTHFKISTIKVTFSRKDITHFAMRKLYTEKNSYVFFLSFFAQFPFPSRLRDSSNRVRLSGYDHPSDNEVNQCRIRAEAD